MQGKYKTDCLEYKQWILVFVGKKHGHLTFPKMGRSTDPHVSAPQWTSPDAKSAVSIPATENEMRRRKEQNNYKEKNSQHLLGLQLWKKNNRTNQPLIKDEDII